MCAYYALYNNLKCTIEVMAPIIPFMTDYIYRQLVLEYEDAPKYVLLADYPTPEKIWENAKIIRQAEIAREIITSSLSLRNAYQIKIKQPLKNLYVFLNDEDREVIEVFGDIIKDELNIKEIIIENDETKFNIPKLTINFKKAGAVLKGNVQKVKNLLLETNEMDKLIEQYNTGYNR